VTYSNLSSLLGEDDGPSGHRSGRGYDPNQPRVPAGRRDGGQWTSLATLSGGRARSAPDHRRRDGLTRVAQANDNFPRVAACTEGAYLCLSNLPSGDIYRRFCTEAELRCNKDVEETRMRQRYAPNTVGIGLFPDGTAVFVPPAGDEPFLLRRGRRWPQ